jgi:hypothetical protein
LRTLANVAKAFLLSARLSDRFWSFAFLTMVYLRNRTRSKGASTIPFTALTGHDPDLSNIRVFGCHAYVNIDSSQRAKFSQGLARNLSRLILLLPNMACV